MQTQPNFCRLSNKKTCDSEFGISQKKLKKKETEHVVETTIERLFALFRNCFSYTHICYTNINCEFF